MHNLYNIFKEGHELSEVDMNVYTPKSEIDRWSVRYVFRRFDNEGNSNCWMGDEIYFKELTVEAMINAGLSEYVSKKVIKKINDAKA